MNEDYIQFLWKSKRLDLNKAAVFNANSIQVINWGSHNDQLKGPDFTLGKVVIDNITFYGSIEIHVKSSDWILHNHQKDSLYNNVILHVVLEYDKPITQSNYLLPTLEIKDCIDQQHFIKYKRRQLNTVELPCSKLLKDLDPIYFEMMKSKAIVRKLNAKSEVLKEKELTDNEVLYYFLAEAFGTSINKEGFHSLIQKVPFQYLNKIKEKQQRRSLILAESGLIRSENDSLSEWHFKGSRPENFPVKRVNQFASFVAWYNFDLLLPFTNELELRHEFYKIVKSFNLLISDSNLKISRSFSNLILINAIVPYLWCLGERNKNENYQNLAIDILQNLPAEKNRIITKWSNIGVDPKNSYDSQSLLSLYRYYCSVKKCLSCEVGIKLIRD